MEGEGWNKRERRLDIFSREEEILGERGKEINSKLWKGYGGWIWIWRGLGLNGRNEGRDRKDKEKERDLERKCIKRSSYKERKKSKERRDWGGICKWRIGKGEEKEISKKGFEGW